MFSKSIFSLLVFLAVSLCSVSQAQQIINEPEAKAPQQAVYLELFGNGFAYTLNYERLVFNDLHLRVGGGYLKISKVGLTSYSFPIMLNKLYGKKNSKLELGAGLVLMNVRVDFEEDKETNHDEWPFTMSGFGFTSTIGYRHQFNNNGIFRIGVQPNYIFGDYFAENSPSFGVALGISFGAAF